MQAGRFRGDGGAATTELVIIAPVLMSMIMLIVQFGLYFHASTIASAAAQEGAGTAAVFPGDDNAARLNHGETEAQEFLTVFAPSLLANPDVDAQVVDGGDAVRVEVTAEVLDVFAVPGVDMDLEVTETAESLIERFRPATDAPPAGS